MLCLSKRKCCTGLRGTADLAAAAAAADSCYHFESCKFSAKKKLKRNKSMALLAECRLCLSDNMAEAEPAWHFGEGTGLAKRRYGCRVQENVSIKSRVGV